MSKTLHRLLERVVSERLADVSEEEKTAAVSGLEAQIAQEIISENADELTMAQARKLQLEEKKYREEWLRISISQAKEAVLAAGVIGVLIGLLANQLTDLISLWKGASPMMPLGWTALACLFLFAANVGAFYLLYVRKIVGLVREFVQKDDGR